MADQITAYPDTHVLIVDDVSLHPMALGKVLRKFGCRLDSAINGIEAVQKMKQRKFDLVFMNCNMPKMDGFAATRAIRAHESHTNGPVIIALLAIP